jgi:peptidoglycan hydrolase-like protein with peptidoglycan-binding domain
MSRRANATAKLLEQVNQQSPGRDRSSDGWIGDKAHASRASDHNPNKSGVVQAQDITHDPAGGFDSYEFAEMLRARRDKRIKYVISNRRIFAGNAGPQPWTWRRYTGSNPHDMHVHVSVADQVALYDDASAWEIGLIPFIPDAAAPAKDLPILRSGSKGFYVEMAQTCLKLPVKQRDRQFGPTTKAAVEQFQRDHGLDDDGIVGAYTWRELLRPWAEEVELIERTPPAPIEPAPIEPTPPVEPIEPVDPIEAATWIENITATVFGNYEGEASAYGGKLDDSQPFVALPYRYKPADSRPWVELKNAAGKVVTAYTQDVGPWMIDDDYASKGTRPIAEICHKAGRPLPSGPQKGRVPTNDAGIDLSPSLARALGIQGKGKVAWRIKT